MDENNSRLQPLTPDLQSLLRTGVALTSVSQCVEELVLNSIDAGATCIAVRVDMSCFKFQVFDNGHGIQKDDLETVAERYYTSKCHTVKDLDNLCYFGYRGEAVASLREISAVLEIVSRTKYLPQSYCKIFQNGNPLPVVESTVPRPSVGTTITSHNLFYNFPVRQKHTNQNLEFEKIRQKLEAIALVHCGISISLRNDITGQVVLQTHKTNSLLNTFTSLFGAAKSSSLHELEAETEHFKIKAYFGKEGSSRKDHQFVYVNKRVVLKTEVSKIVNSILGKSLIVKAKTSYTKALLEDSPTKHVDRYPIFVILLECAFSEYDITFEPAKTFVQFKHWESLKDSLEKLAQSFLVKENLLLSKADSASPKDNSCDREEFEESPEMTSVDTSDISRDIHTSMIRAGMSSKLVKRKKDFYHEESIVLHNNQSPMKDTENGDDIVASDLVDKTCIHSPSNNVEEIPTGENLEEERNDGVCFGIESGNCGKDKDQIQICMEEHERLLKTPLTNKTDEREPPRLHCKKVCESQASVDTEDVIVEYDEEDPLNFHNTGSHAQDEVPQKIPKKNYICISTPYISPGGNSTLSTFKKSIHSTRTGRRHSSEKISLAEKLKQRKSNGKSAEKHGRHSQLPDVRDHVPEKDSLSGKRNHKSSFEKSLSQKLKSAASGISVKDNTRNINKNGNVHLRDDSVDTERKTDRTLEHGVKKQVQTRAIDCLRSEGATSTVCHCCNKSVSDCDTIPNRGAEASVLENQISNSTDSHSEINLQSNIHQTGNPSLESENVLTASHETLDTVKNGVDPQPKKRKNVDAAETTSSKLSKLVQENRETEQNNDDVFSSSSQSRYFGLDEFAIPVSLQMGFQFKSAKPSESTNEESSNLSGKKYSISPPSFLQTAQVIRNNHAEKENITQNFLEKKKSMRSIEEFEIWPPNSNNSYQLNDHTEVPTVNKTFDDSYPNLTSHIRDPFIVEIDDFHSDAQYNSRNAGNKSQQEVEFYAESEFQEAESKKNELDFECDLICDETLDDIETSTRRVKEFNEVKQCEPLVEAFWNFEESQEFIPTDLTFDSDFSREIQEPSRKKLNLSLVASLGFNFSSINGSKSGENTPNTPNSDLTVPTFELRTCCSPTGSEGFSPNLDLQSPNSNHTPTPDHLDLFNNGEMENAVDKEDHMSSVPSENQDSLKILTLSRILEKEEQNDSLDQSPPCLSSEEGDNISKWFSLGSNCASCEENSRTQNDFVPNGSLSESPCSNNLHPQHQADGGQDSSKQLTEAEPLTEQHKGNAFTSCINRLECSQEVEDKPDKNLLQSTSDHPVPSNPGESSPWSELADDELMNLDIDQCKESDPEPQKIWIKIADKTTGRDIFVNKNTGHTVTDENLIPKEERQDERNKVTEASQCRRFVKNRTSTCSPSITSSIQTMIEEHFDADDEMISVKWKDKEALEGAQGPCVADLFKEWENPVFLRPEMDVLNAEAPKERTVGASKAQRSLNPCTFTKDMLKNIQVLGQMDNKFIVCVMKTDDQATGTELLVVFDQHAAHERVRLEQLTKDCYESSEGRQFKSCILSPPEELKLTEEDVRVMEAFQGEFSRIGICFSKSQLSRDSVLIKEIPTCITTKEVKQRDGIIILNILKNTITEHIQFLKSTKGAKNHMPLTIHKLLCGLACRGAIKFGDALTKEECGNLLQSLSLCDLPFQCAHGRPSVMPLIATDRLTNKYVTKRPNLWKIAKKLQCK